MLENYRQHGSRDRSEALFSNNSKEAFMRRLKTSLLACAAFVAIAAPTLAQSLPQQNDSYFIAAAKHLQDMTARKPIDGPAKNVILFVGDGMSIPDGHRGAHL